MCSANSPRFRRQPNKSLPLAASLMALLLTLQPVLVSGAAPSARRESHKHKMSGDQRIVHVLSRLTFGARPGDFEKVKAMGVEAFINQQLDPDSIDVAALSARLRRLPTLGMATPVIIEQYTPPKPAVSPSPAPSKSPESSGPPPKAIVQNPVSQTPTLAANANMPGTQNETQMEAKKEMGAPAMQKLEGVKPGEPQQANPAPRPSPPAKNPQMVVTELQRAKLL